MNKKIVIVSVILLIVIVGGLIWGVKTGAFGKGKGEKVALQQAALRTVVETVTASGKIYPEQEVKLSSEVSGEIVALHVKEGDTVHAGQLLLEVNASILRSVVDQSEAGLNQIRANRSGAQAALIQAQAALDQARRTYSRQQELFAEKIISANDFENAELALKQAESAFASASENVNAANYNINSGQAQVNQARENLLRTRIYAPNSGIVSLLSVKLGEKVVGTAQMAGTELIRIANLSNMQAEVEVNENDVVRMHIGDTAEIEVDAYINRKFKGVVTFIAYSSQSAGLAAATSQATNFTVKVRILPESYTDLINLAAGVRFPFRPGMNCTVEIKTQQKENILTVPIQSVAVRDPESVAPLDSKKDTVQQLNAGVPQEMVFVAEGMQVKAVPVKTGIQDANYIEIISGLKAGQQIVSAPFKLISKTLREGDLIEVVDEKELFETEAQ